MNFKRAASHLTGSPISAYTTWFHIKWIVPAAAVDVVA